MKNLVLCLTLGVAVSACDLVDLRESSKEYQGISHLEYTIRNRTDSAFKEGSFLGKASVSYESSSGITFDQGEFGVRVLSGTVKPQSKYTTHFIPSFLGCSREDCPAGRYKVNMAFKDHYGRESKESLVMDFDDTNRYVGVLRATQLRAEQSDFFHPNYKQFFMTVENGTNLTLKPGQVYAKLLLSVQGPKGFKPAPQKPFHVQMFFGEPDALPGDSFDQHLFVDFANCPVSRCPVGWYTVSFEHVESIGPNPRLSTRVYVDGNRLAK